MARQERELSRFTKTEADLPVIMRAHNEETRVLKIKIKQAQDTNKKIRQSVKTKDNQIMSLTVNHMVKLRAWKDQSR